jgi:hypothetical protein
MGQQNRGCTSGLNRFPLFGHLDRLRHRIVVLTTMVHRVELAALASKRGVLRAIFGCIGIATGLAYHFREVVITRRIPAMAYPLLPN